MSTRGGGRLLLAATVGNLADGVRVSAFPLLVAGLSTSPFVVALSTALTHLPWLLFALYAGLVVDRHGARRALVLSHAIRALFMLPALAVAAFGGRVALLLAVIFAMGVLEVFVNTAEPTLVPAVVEADALATTNATLSVIEPVMNSFLGVALGAVLFGVTKWLPFVIVAIAYCGATVLLSTLRPREIRTAEARGQWGDNLLDGVRFVCSNRILLTLAVVTGLANFAMTAFFSVLVLYVRRFGYDTQYLFAASLTAVSAGSVLTPGLIGPARRWFGDAWVLRGAIVLLTVALGIIATADRLPLALVGFVAIGVAVGLWGTVAVTFRQEVVPEQLLGRANAFYRLVSYGSAPLGALFSGGMSEFAGVTQTCTAAAILTLLCWPLLPLISHRQMTHMRQLGATLKEDVS
ncbi:MFS transporter [Paraburkholderia sp. RL17-337-BIB-A]|uniref:MFS transporter n=1 Tax=Paraburkholderia sp. RL17-337-BIB-A TaxID=3031636 RepID=UPI0038B9AD5E